MPDIGKWEWPYTRQRISELHPAWTFDYIDQLSYAQVIEIFGYQKALQMVRDDQKD